MCVYLCNRVPACAGQAGALRAAVPFGKPSAHSLEQLEAAREAWEVVLRIEPDNGDADLQMALVETEMAAAVGGGGYAAVVHAAHTTGTAYTHGSSGAAGLPSRFGGMVQRGPASSGRSPLCSVLERLERARLRSAADTPALLLHTAACLLRLEMAEAPVEPLPLLLPSRAEFALAEAAEEAAELRAAAEARAAAAAAAVAADDPLGLEAGEGLSADEILAAAIDGRVLSLPADPRPASDRDEAEPLAARLETEEGGGEGGGGEGGGGEGGGGEGGGGEGGSGEGGGGEGAGGDGGGGEGSVGDEWKTALALSSMCGGKAPRLGSTRPMAAPPPTPIHCATACQTPSHGRLGTKRLLPALRSSATSRSVG